MPYVFPHRLSVEQEDGPARTRPGPDSKRWIKETLGPTSLLLVALYVGH